MRFNTPTPPGPNVVSFGNNFTANGTQNVSGILTNGQTQLTGLMVVRNDIAKIMYSAMVDVFPTGPVSHMVGSAPAGLMNTLGGPATQYQAIIPINIPPGAQFEVSTLMSGTSVASYVSIYGLNGPSPDVLVRSDGRTWPNGSLAVGEIVSNWLVGAVPFGRYMIKSISHILIGAAGGPGLQAVSVTIDGVGVNLCPTSVLASGYAGNSQDYPEGILCDYNTSMGGITFGTTPATVQAFLTYDLVL